MVDFVDLRVAIKSKVTSFMTIKSKRTFIGTSPTVLSVVVALAGCGSGGSRAALSGSSSCEDFTEAGINEQSKVINALAEDSGKDSLFAGGSLAEIIQTCRENANATVGQLFQKELEEAEALISGGEGGFEDDGSGG